MLPALRTLIVDDEPDIRLMLGLILAETAAEVAFAGDLSEAYACSRDFKPDLVLLDIRLGGKPAGLELCATLKGARNGLLPMVVMLTADDSSTTLAEACAHGADGYLIKPFTPSQILGLADSFDAWRLDTGRAPPAFWPAPRFLR